MPRQARIDAPDALHHVIVRGIERQKIFRSDNDRDDFIERLENILTKTSTACYAWALIPNHVHLLLRTGTIPVSDVMRRLLTGYAVSYNLKHNRSGHLFQNRYKSILCQEEPYFLELVRYIHLNPLRAGLVRDYAELNRYAYAGHGAILGKHKNSWQDIIYVLAFFDRSESLARRQYRQYVEQGIEQGRRPDLIGGGLIRSLGGWAESRKIIKKPESRKGDERILGDSDFVMDTLAQHQDQLERKYALKNQGYDLKRLTERVAKLFNIAPEEIFRSGKYRQSVQARSVYCYWAVRELGETATALAKALRLTQPAVSIAVHRGELIVKEKKLSL
jgi:REP element-mobilizing transposase RayT